MQAAWGISLGANHGAVTPFFEGLEVRNGTQVACTLSLNLSLTYCKPHPPFYCQPETLVCLGPFLFSWLPTTLSEEISLFGNSLKTPPLYTFNLPFHLLWGV